MVGICYPSPSRHSGAYEPSHVITRTRTPPNTRGRKNLFKTALDKLTKKHKNKKAPSENVYEVIVLYKDKHEDHENGYVSKDNDLRSLYSNPKRFPNKEDNTNEQPRAPPRTRSRSHSRISCRSSEINTIPPTPPPRSRSHSRRSSMRSPTPPPRSRPQSRNSCRGTLHKAQKISSNHVADIEPEKRSDNSKPPIPPMRSPLRKQKQKQLQTTTVRRSLSLADLATGLDYIDLDELEEIEEEKKPRTIKNSASSSKLYNSEDISACNARMDSRWEKVLKSSNLSLNTEHKMTEKETYLGPGGAYNQGLSSEARAQSYHQIVPTTVPENSLGYLAPTDRVKLSLGRLDIPDWYAARQDREDTVSPSSPRPAWKKGSFPNIKCPTSSSTPTSPIPPSSPSPSRSHWRNNLREKSFSPCSPSPPSSPTPKLYTGWRSQERLPTFLPETMESRLERGRAATGREE